MHLWAHSDASYLRETRGRSRAGGYAYLSLKPKYPLTPDSSPLPHNHAVHVVCKVIDAVISSAQEAETAARFVTARDLVPIRQTLEELGYSQGPTPLQFDNKCATDIIMETVKQKCLKSWTCGFTGYVIVYGKGSSTLTGNEGTKILRITSPSTTLLNIT